MSRRVVVLALLVLIVGGYLVFRELPILQTERERALADLLVVDGDPLEDIGDALKIVAVVRNGRFFSVSGLIDRANSAKNVDLFE